MEAWANFFIAVSGVAAILAGLIFVAVAAGLPQMLKSPHLLPRVRATVSTLLLVVMIGLVGLVPQPASAFAIEVLVLSAVGWTIAIACTREVIEHHLQANRPALELLIGVPGAHVAALTFVVGAVLLWAENGHGLYWIVAGVVVTLFSTMMNVWVLMVEALR